MSKTISEFPFHSERLLISGHDFALCPGGAHSIVFDDDEVHLIGRYEDTAAESVAAFSQVLARGKAGPVGFSHELGQTSGGCESGSGVHARRSDPVKLIGFLITVLLVMVTLGILDVFGNSLHHYVGELIEHHVLGHHSDGVEGKREFWLLFTSGFLLCGGVAWVYFSHAPLLEEDVESVGHRVQAILRDFVQSKRLLLRRLQQVLRGAGCDKKRRLHIWNVNPLSDSFELLFGACQDVLPDSAQIVVHVRRDELPTAGPFIRERAGGASVAVLDEVSGTAPGEGGRAEDLAADTARLTLLLDAERQLLSFLRLASFPEGAFCQDSATAPGQAAHFFSERCFNHWFQLLGAGVDHEQAGNFLRRCQQDYGLLCVSKGDSRHLDLVLSPVLAHEDSPARAHCDDATLRRMIKYRLLRSDFFGLLDDTLLADPLSCLVVVYVLRGILQESDMTPPQRYGVGQQLSKVFAAWVFSMERTERVELLRHVFPSGKAEVFPLSAHLPKVVEESISGLVERGAGVRHEVSQLTVWAALGVAPLQALARLMETSGEYERAAHIWQVLAPMQPLVSEVRLARLAERRGRNAEALERIDRAVALLGGSGALVSTRIAADVHLEFAWIIYSANASSRINEGQASLDAAAGLLLQLDVNAVDTSMYFWRLHNYTALYQDRNGDYEAALESHKKALGIPGVKGKWLSGTLVNLAYVQRKAALQGGDAARGDALGLRECEAGLLKALEYARLAVNFKERLNDKDELPITLHNLAAIGICLRLVAPSFNMPEDVRWAARRGLSLLDELGADKKRFALLLEAWCLERLNSGDAAAIGRALVEYSEQVSLADAELSAIACLEDHDGMDRIGRGILALELLN